jgi:CubicO group peptidase (beta-lactamase class C family)
MKKLFFLFPTILGFYTAIAQTTTPLDAYVLDKMKDKNYIPGLGFSLIKNEKIALAKGYGYADLNKDIPFTPNTIMSEIASISKTVTATAVMKLWEQGLFQLDDPINNYLPFAVKNPYYSNTPITFRMLLCHKSSIHTNEQEPISILYVQPPGTGMSLQNYLQNRLVAGGSLYNFEAPSFNNNAPGVQWQYSNTGYALLGYLVERISGMPFAQYCKQNIFQPLCMNQTAWFYAGVDTNIVARPYHGYNGNSLNQAEDWGLYERLDYPCIQIKTTLTDLSKYLQMHMNYGILNGVRIIDSTTEVMMRTPQVLLVDNAVVIHDNVALHHTAEECLGFWKITGETINGNKVYFGHPGDDRGVDTQFWINASDKTGVILFANGEGVDNQVFDVYFQLDQVVADTVSTAGLPSLNCSYNYFLCQHNLDYWKNNSDKWALNSVPMKLGTKHYYSKNQILDLLNRPVNSDASIVLAKALITAKFNVAQGSEISPIIQTINSSMSLIGDHRLPYDNPVSFISPTGIQMLGLAATLNSYDSGNLNTTICSGTLPAVTRADVPNENRAAENSLSVFPNPASLQANISFFLAQSEKASIKIFDVSGKMVRYMANNTMEAGMHRISWNTRDEKGNSVSSGTYLIKIDAGSYSETKKIFVMR